MSDPEPQATPWGERARETFWFTMGLAALFAILADVADLAGNRAFLVLRIVNAVVWTVAAVIWATAAIKRRRAVDQA